MNIRNQKNKWMQLMVGILMLIVVLVLTFTMFIPLIKGETLNWSSSNPFIDNTISLDWKYKNKLILYFGIYCFFLLIGTSLIYDAFKK